LADLTIAAAAEIAVQSPEDELLNVTSQLRREVRAFTQGSRPAASRDANDGLDVKRWVARNQGPDPSGGPAAGKGPAVVTPVAAEPGLAGRVAAATNRCRLARGPLSLGLVAVDQHHELLLQLGPSGAADLLHWLKIDLAGWAGQRTGAAQVGEATFALLWENCPRSDAVETIRHVLTQVKTWRMPGSIGQDLEISLSAGVATLALPPKNFPSQQLIDAAQRCLSGVQLSGGGSIKSIEF
jgi:GGDEF domain-containing protein